MSSKGMQKASSALAVVAIFVLVALIVVMWVEYGPASFRRKEQNGDREQDTELLEEDVEVAPSNFRKKIESTGKQYLGIFVVI